MGKNIWALYALTWHKPNQSAGTYFDGFVMNAWANWLPPRDNSGYQKLVRSTVKKCDSSQLVSPESGENPPSETDTYE